MIGRLRGVDAGRFVANALLALAGVLLSLWAARAVTLGDERLAIAATLALAGAAVAVVRPRVAIAGTFVFLALMGDLRRLLLVFVDGGGQDPLLLVGPAVAASLALPALARGSVLASPLARLVAALGVVMALQMLNPLQGNLLVGVAGALFYIVPLLWFFIGRRYGTPAFTRWIVFRLLPGVALAAACFGLYQAFFGWLPYQERWYEIAGYASLYVGQALRPISFFTSSSEYVQYALAALVVLLAVAFRRRPLAFVPAGFLLAAIFLVSSRGPMVRLVVVGAFVWALLGVRRASWLPRLLLAAVLAGGAGVALLARLPEVDPSSPVGGFVAHQTRGLLNPLDREHSTATVHAAMFANGFRRALEQPLGYGLGATTLASKRFSGTRFSTEVDISNLFVSLGLVGGVLYLGIIALVLGRALLAWQRQRSTLTLALAGLLLVTLGGWLHGSHYSLSALIWFLIGALDRIAGEAPGSAVGDPRAAPPGGTPA